MKKLIVYTFISFIQLMPLNIQAQSKSDLNNYHLADNSYLDSNYQLSINFLTNYLKSNPNDFKAFSLRGDSYRQLNQNNDALHDYSEAIKIKQGVVSLYLKRASIYDSLQRYEDELKDFNKAIEIDPKNSESFLSRGLYYSIHGKRDKSIEDYGKAIKLNPGYSAAYGNRGLDYFKEKHYDVALKDFNKAITLGSKDWRFFWRRGSIFSNHKGENDKAVLDFGKAIDLINVGNIREEQMGEPYYNRGSIYMYFTEKWDEALQDFNIAIFYNSKSADYFLNRGKVYFQKGDKAKAKEDWYKAIEFNPNLQDVLGEYLNE